MINLIRDVRWGFYSCLDTSNPMSTTSYPLSLCPVLEALLSVARAMPALQHLTQVLA